MNFWCMTVSNKNEEKFYLDDFELSERLAVSYAKLTASNTLTSTSPHVWILMAKACIEL